MDLQGNISYLWKKKIITILEDLQIFVRKTTSESRHCCNVNAKSENRRRKHNVPTMLVFDRSNDVGNNVATTLWQHDPTYRPKYNQNLTLLQRRVPAGEESVSFINKEGIVEKKAGEGLNILITVMKRNNYILKTMFEFMFF